MTANIIRHLKRIKVLISTPEILQTLVGSSLALLAYVVIINLIFRSETLRIFISRGMKYGAQLLCVTCVCVAIFSIFKSYRPTIIRKTLSIKYYESIAFGLFLLFSLLIYTFPVFAIATKGALTDTQRFSTYGGYIPWSDAGGYYHGTQELYYTGMLDSWNSRRPLNALFLSARMIACGQNFQYSMILQAAFLGFSSCIFSWTLFKIRGIGCGLIAFCIVYAFGWQYAAITLSEAFGITLGLLATTMLLVGVWQRRAIAQFLGVFLVVIALNARAGAFFTIPMIVFSLSTDSTGSNWFNWRRLMLLSSAVVLAFAFNTGLSSPLRNPLR